MLKFFITGLGFILLFVYCTSDKNTTEQSELLKTKVSEQDTFFGGKQLYCITNTTQAVFESVFNTKTDTSEINCIKTCQDCAKRNSDTLSLKLDNGSVKYYINNSSIESDNYTQYHFITKLPEINYYLLKVFYYEAFSYLMINAKTGKETYLCGVPAVSPDKTKLIAGCFDLQAGFVFNGLQLFSVTSDSLNNLWSRELTKWGADNLAWIDNATIVAEQIRIDSAMNTKTTYVTLNECK